MQNAKLQTMKSESTSQGIQVVKKSSSRWQEEAVSSVLDEKYYGKPKRQHIKEFGCVFGILFCILGGIKGYGGNLQALYLALAATAALLFAAYRTPNLVHPLWSGWMKFAHGLGVVMSFVFVTVTWVLVAVPIGLLLRVIGKKVMDLSFHADVDSYWEERSDSQHDFKLLERQF